MMPMEKVEMMEAMTILVGIVALKVGQILASYFTVFLLNDLWLTYKMLSLKFKILPYWYYGS